MAGMRSSLQDLSKNTNRSIFQPLFIASLGLVILDKVIIFVWKQSR